VSEFYLKTLIPVFARGIRDIGKPIRNEFLGTGTSAKKDFQLEYYPLKADTIEVYVDGVRELGITINSEYGIVTFDVAPADGTTITANYLYYGYSDGLLQDYLADAVGRLEILYYQGYVVLRDVDGDAYLEATPTNVWQMITVLQAIITFVESGLVEDKLITTRKWKDEELSESYTKSVTITKSYLENLYRERDNAISALKRKVMSGLDMYIASTFNKQEAYFRYIDSIAYGSYQTFG